MKASEAIELIASLRDAFPSHHFPPSSVKVNAEMIGDLDGNAVGQAVRETMAESRFYPTIAEIRERVSRTACGGLPSVEAALAELDAAVRKFSPDNSSTWTWDDDWSHPLIARAARIVGGVAQLWGSRAPGVDRREFKAAYLSLVAEQVRAVQLGVAAPMQVRALDSAS